LCKGKIGIYLDLKNAPIEELVKFIKARGMEHDVIWYIGAGQVPLLRSVCPECVPMPDPGVELMLPQLLSSVKPQVVAGTWRSFSKAFVEKCHAAGAVVIVDDGGPKTWKDTIDWGTDGIQTDHPKDLIQLLDERAKTSGK
jgi:glycerophosphoryl diester phosphodiesterase